MWGSTGKKKCKELHWKKKKGKTFKGAFGKVKRQKKKKSHPYSAVDRKKLICKSFYKSCLFIENNSQFLILDMTRIGW